MQCELTTAFLRGRTSPSKPVTSLLQVDYTGFSTINAQRFGQKFVGKVANPHDLLLFCKAAARAAKADEGEATSSLRRPSVLRV
jgi:double-strand break repair protein MRE11